MNVHAGLDWQDGGGEPSGRFGGKCLATPEEGTLPIFPYPENRQDLNDFAHALDLPTRIYRVKKFIVNGRADYYSPDQSAPVISAAPNESATKGAQDFDVVEQLGGGTPILGERGTKCYKLTDGTVIHVKRSKYHEKNDYYWYGLNPRTLAQIKTLGATHIAFVLGEWGFVNVPVSLVEGHLPHTRSSLNPDGSIRHYHLLISPEPDPALHWSADAPRVQLSEYSQPFSS